MYGRNVVCLVSEKGVRQTFDPDTLQLSEEDTRALAYKEQQRWHDTAPHYGAVWVEVRPWTSRH